MTVLKAKYRPFPKHSPYVAGDRYEILKEDHKYFIHKLKSVLAGKQNLRFCDVGCGNGEMIYQIRKVFPTWQYTGYDFTKDFIEAAKRFKGLSGVDFHQKDILNLDQIQTFDVVFCSSVFQIFTDIRTPLKNLLGLCKKGGYLFIDGLFNPLDVEVRLQYCDNTHRDTKGVWRSDWNQHSQASLKRALNGKVRSASFEEVVNDLDIRENPKKPINRWTFRDQNGKNITTNATRLMMPRILMTIRK